MSAAKVNNPSSFPALTKALRPRLASLRLATKMLSIVALSATSVLTLSTPVSAAPTLSRSSEVTTSVGVTASQLPSRNQSWIDASYRLFLGRPATRDELDTGQTAINIGGRLSLTESLATSPEWAGVVVDDLFQSALDRQPDSTGRTFWIDELGQGARTRDISISIFGSIEAQTRSASNSTYVGDLYGRILGRSPESVGLHFWTTRLDNGSQAWEIVNGLWDSTEFRNTRVTTTYEQVLGRKPDGAGQSYWAGRLLSIDEVRLAAFLAASDEFYEAVDSLDVLPDPAIDPTFDPISNPTNVPIPSVPRPVQSDHSLGVLLELVRVAPEGVSHYDRGDWDHWSDLDGDGCDTRCQVKKDEQLPTIDNGNVGYFSVYDGVVFGPTEAGMHLDHVVALAEAHRSGGHDWSPEKKEAFANDLGWDRSLILVSATTNLSKSSRDPASWMPPAAALNPEVGCTYLRDWVGGKYRWDLTIDETERSAIVANANQLGCFGTSS